VQRALDDVALHPAVGQRGGLMGARVVDGEQLVVLGAEDRDGHVGSHQADLSRCQVDAGADRDHRPSS
jgi:hypothetical protein